MPLNVHNLPDVLRGLLLSDIGNNKPMQSEGESTARPASGSVADTSSSALGTDRRSRTIARERNRRSRAAVACNICRSRKTRCDNKRPSCGYCLLHGLQCQYPDSIVLANELRDPIASNAAILDGVNRALTMLEDLKQKQENATFRPNYSHPQVADRDHQQHAQVNHDPDRRQDVTSSEPAIESSFTNDGFGQLEIPQTSARTSACESILRWPSLAGLGLERNAMSYALEAAASDDDGSNDTPLGRIEEDRVFPLCTRFLTLIHVKNPILDVAEFKRHVHNAAAMGFGWDAGGCLVLLACALACVAVPYNSEAATAGMNEEDYDPTINVDIPAAEAFYNAARRRIGLLGNSLVATQCGYLAGLYDKFLVRPVAAWTLLQAACVKLQALLYAKGLAEATGQTSRTDTRAKHVEQRLYWSCVKAECELRAELQLPSSQLLQFRYPDLFPSLSFPTVSELHLQLSPEATTSSPLAQTQTWLSPSGMTPGMSNDANNHTLSNLQPEEERSWLHYLAEISLRGIMNRVLSDLYANGEEVWLSVTSSMIRKCTAYIEELRQWHAHLPPQLSFAEPLAHLKSSQGTEHQLPSSELAFFLLTRYVGVMEWIYRPFLYAYLHGCGPDSHFAHNVAHYDDSTDAYIRRMAGQAIASADILIQIVSVHHRHGGIWGLVRRAWGACLLLVAASRRHRQWEASLGPEAVKYFVEIPRGCELQIKKVQHLCRIWGVTGSAGLQRMAQVMNDLEHQCTL